ncbi:50S ribosomal protein L13 [Candidatus Woesearchaeota archaeon]|nr:50S ribosomal protein L13 [Candidatus Woesearchaeota archaeon]
MKILNGENIILGRLAAEAAKQALMGEEVIIVNCEKVVISGRKSLILAREKRRRERKGYPLKSHVIPRLPERSVRRSIRGMLPWKSIRGKEAFARVKCFRSIPAEYADKKIILMPQNSLSKLPNLKYISLSEICHHLGGKHD